jgi:hypothetical protein
VAACVLLAAVLLCHAQLSWGVEKGASVSLAARWQGTPLMQEAAEMLVSLSATAACPTWLPAASQ